MAINVVSEEHCPSVIPNQRSAGCPGRLGSPHCWKTPRCTQITFINWIRAPALGAGVSVSVLPHTPFRNCLAFPAEFLPWVASVRLRLARARARAFSGSGGLLVLGPRLTLRVHRRNDVFALGLYLWKRGELGHLLGGFGRFILHRVAAAGSKLEQGQPESWERGRCRR